MSCHRGTTTFASGPDSPDAEPNVLQPQTLFASMDDVAIEAPVVARPADKETSRGLGFETEIKTISRRCTARHPVRCGSHRTRRCRRLACSTPKLMFFAVASTGSSMTYGVQSDEPFGPRLCMLSKASTPGRTIDAPPQAGESARDAFGLDIAAEPNLLPGGELHRKCSSGDAEATAT